MFVCVLMESEGTVVGLPAYAGGSTTRIDDTGETLLQLDSIKLFTCLLYTSPSPRDS